MTGYAAIPEAAVAIVQAREPRESLLLMRRSERAEDPWSGHWCFPGGRKEPQDSDLLDTALLELAEECDIRLSREGGAAEMPHMLAGRRVGRHILVAPYVLSVERELETVLDQREAVEALWFPVSALRDPARHALRPVRGQPPEVLFPSIEMGNIPLWGFTYRLIVDLLGVWPPGAAGAAAANDVLDFVLSLGSTLVYGWEERPSSEGPVKAAGIAGKIPVEAVTGRFAAPGRALPAVHALEVRAEFIRVVGAALEEYVIRGEEPRRYRAPGHGQGGRSGFGARPE